MTIHCAIVATIIGSRSRSILEICNYNYKSIIIDKKYIDDEITTTKNENIGPKIIIYKKNT